MHFSINVKLGEALKQLKITPNKFAKECRIKPNTIYELVDNKKDRITFNTLGTIIFTLNRLSKEKNRSYTYSIENVIEYKEKLKK